MLLPSRIPPSVVLASLLASVQGCDAGAGSEPQTCSGAKCDTLEDGDESLEAELVSVVLVGDDDVLNVRAQPGTEFEIIGELAFNERNVLATGQRAAVGDSIWYEVVLDDASVGWAHSHFLTEQVRSAAFENDTRAAERVDHLLFAFGDDPSALADIASGKGLFLEHFHFDRPERFKSDALAGLLDSNRDLCLPTAAGEECLHGTFSELVGEQFLATFNAPDMRIGVDEFLSGPNASALLVPPRLENFHFLSVHNPGTEAESFIDWETWNVFLSYEDGVPKVVGLQRDHWSP